MGRKHETRIIALAGQEARRIIQGEDDRTAAAEKLEDLIGHLDQAEDEIRRTAGGENLAIRPRRQVNFPDPRSVMQAAREVVYEEAHDELGIPMDERSPETVLGQAMEAAPALEELISGNTWLGRHDESPGARLAVATLKSINRDIAQESLNELDPEERRALLQAAVAAVTGE